MVTAEYACDLPGSALDLQLAINSAPALIHTALPDGYLDFFNQGWLEYVGRPLEELQGWKWTVAIHPDDLEGILEPLWPKPRDASPAHPERPEGSACRPPLSNRKSAR
jgi:PAS domain-containing protein